jgi:hypothetical protein
MDVFLPLAIGVRMAWGFFREVTTMDNTVYGRRAWLRIMYLYTVIGAGGFGFGILFFPGLVQTLFNMPPQDPSIFKLVGSFMFAAGLIAIPALLFPMKFVGLLMLQLFYKPVWIALVALPLFLKGQFPLYVVAITIIFVSYIVGDLIAIPFRHVFSKS